MEYKNERIEVANIMRRLYQQKLTSSSGGNISMRNSDGFVFITASQTDKSCIEWDNIIIIDKNGKNLTPSLKPSMECGMHIAIYEIRPDIKAIVDAHPIYASTFAVTEQKLVSSLTGEARYVLGDIQYINYELMGTPALATACAKALTEANVGIMQNHGAICLGESLFHAFDRMEVLEFTAHMFFNTLILKDCNKLGNRALKDIDGLKNNL